MSILKTAAASKAARLTAIAGLVGAAMIGLTTSADAATASYKVAPATGPTAGGDVVTITGTGFRAANNSLNLFAGATAVQYTTGTCPATHAAATATVLDSASLSVPSATQIVSTTPALALTSSKPTAYNICVYGTANSNALLGTTKYTAYAAPTIGAANYPASGPAAGGNTVVITGTNFTKASVVKFGNVVASKPTVAKDGTSITVTAPAQAAGAVAVSVTTEGGTNATPGTATWDDYTYTNAINVSPQFGKNATATTITLKGVGFKSLNFAAGANNAAVMFVPTTYAAATHGVGGTDAAPLCTNIQVVNDTTLVCDTPNNLSDTAYIVVTVADKDEGAGTPNASVISSSAAFTFAAF